MQLRNTISTLALVASTSLVSAQPPLQKIRAYCQSAQNAILSSYRNFLAIPNVASDSSHLQENAVFIQEQLQQLGVKTELLRATTPGVPPVVYGEAFTPGAQRTIIFYAHYDGQPVNPAKWAEGIQPFEPVLYTNSIEKGGRKIPFPDPNTRLYPDWRLYSRSSSDDKAGVMAILQAYKALQENKIRPTCHIKFFFEGEEEKGSPHLDEILTKYTDLLQSDLWIIADGPTHPTGRKLISYGVRGDVNVEITIYGPNRPLHSGHYGNWAPNPALRLVQLLASMKDSTGHVTIPGWYDDVVPFSATEKKLLAQTPQIDEALAKELGFLQPEGGGQSLNALLNLPSLNINGLQSADVGPYARNVIPATATAALDLRLVLGNEWEKQVNKLISFVKSKGYHVVRKDPTPAERLQYPLIAKISVGSGYNAQRTPLDLPISQQVIRALQATTIDPIVVMPTTGGSLPLYLIEKILGAKVITVPIVNYDNNQHAENENLRIQNLWEGIESLAALMIM